MAESRGVGENFLPTGPSVILSIPRSHLFPLLQTAPQSAEDTQPALSDSLQHWHILLHLCAQCPAFPVCRQMLGNPQEVSGGERGPWGAGPLWEHRPAMD